MTLQEVNFWIEADLRLSRQLYGGWVVAGSFLTLRIPGKGLLYSQVWRWNVDQHR